MSDCPSRETLQRLLDETLPPGERPGVEAHVQCCPRCQEVLTKLTPLEGALARSAVIPQRKNESGTLFAVAPADTALPRESCDADQPVSARARNTGNTADQDRDDSVLCGRGVDATDSTSKSFKSGEPTSDGVPVLGTVGDYELLEEIGRGGMGVVYRARQRTLNRIVALKMIVGGQLASDKQVQRFRAEAQAAAHLDHPGIVPIFEVGECDGRLFYSMGYVVGPTLQNRLRDQPLLPREAAELVRKIAEAVSYAHGRQVVHRDLKPANILVDEAGQPKVTDFGLAKRLDVESGLTLSGQIMGTPSYMAPEQAAGRNKHVGPAADIYALGGVLYALLTGKPPFRAATVHETIRLLREDEPVRPRLLNPAIDRDLETICLKCLEKSVTGRYVSAAALGDELRRYLAGEPILARPLGSATRLYRWYRRKPVLAIFASATILLLVISAFVGTVGYVATTRALHRESAALKISEDQRGQLREALERAKQERQRAQEERGRAEKQRDRSEWLLYTIQIAGAQSEWEHGDAVKAWRYLDACRWDLRGWEHDYLYTLFNRNQRTMVSGTPVSSVAFSPDGRRIASGSRGSLVNLAFSPDRRTAVPTVTKGSTVQVWDATTGQETLTVKGHTPTEGTLAFSPDGRRIASASSDSTVQVWDATTGQETLTIKGHPVVKPGVYFGGRCLAFSPDGRRIASGSGVIHPANKGWLQVVVQVWDATTGEEALTLKGHSGVVTSVAFSPDGRRIASVGIDNAVKVWDATTGKETLTFKGAGGLAFSPDGRRIAAADAGTVQVWDVTTGQETLTFKASAGSLAFSPDGLRIAGASKGNTVQVWDATTGDETLTLKGHTSDVRSVAFSPDGRWIASGSMDSTVKVWSVTTCQETPTLKGHKEGISSVAFSPDGRRIASASRDSTVKVWDATTGQETLTLKGHPGSGGHGRQSVAFSSDGRRIASASLDGTVKVWDATTGQETLTLKGQTPGVQSMALSPDGRRIASASKGTVKVWDATTGEETLTIEGHALPVQIVAFSPDSRRIASAGWDETVKVWDATTGQETLTLKGHTRNVKSVAFSPDGRRIASGGDDSTVKVWDATTGEETLTLREHTGSVNSVAFSPDGRRIASGGGDGTVKVWDATTRQETPEGRPWHSSRRQTASGRSASTAASPAAAKPNGPAPPLTIAPPAKPVTAQ